MTALASLGPSVQHVKPQEDSNFCSSGSFLCQNSVNANAKSADKRSDRTSDDLDNNNGSKVERKEPSREDQTAMNAKSADKRSDRTNDDLDNNNGSKVERKEPSREDQTAMTIEFLRARLLSERAASRAAREEAQQNAKKVLELQSQLQLEIERRTTAEAAMEDVVAKLRQKGLTVSSLSGSESDQLCQEASSELTKTEVENSRISFQRDEKGDTTFQRITSSDESGLLENKNNVGDQGDSFEQELSNKTHAEYFRDLPCSKNSGDLNRKDEATVDLNENIATLTEERGSNQLQSRTKVSDKRMVSQTSNQARESKIFIEKQLQYAWNRVEEEIAALTEGQSQRHVVRLKMQDLLDNVTSLLGEILQEGQSNNKLVSSIDYTSYPMDEEMRGKSQATEGQDSVVSEIPFKSKQLAVEEVFQTKFASAYLSEEEFTFDGRFSQQEEINKSEDGTAMLMARSIPRKAGIRTCQTDNCEDDVDIHAVRETANNGFGVTPILSDEKLLIEDRGTFTRSLAPGYEVQKAAFFESDLKMGAHCDPPNPEVSQLYVYGALPGHAFIANGRNFRSTLMDHTRADGLHSVTEQVIQKQWNQSNLLPKDPDQILVENLSSQINDQAGLSKPSHGHEPLPGGLPFKREFHTTEGDQEDANAFIGREKSILKCTSTFSSNILELATGTDSQNDMVCWPKEEYQFRSKVYGDSRSHLYQEVPSKKSTSTQTSKRFQEGRVWNILAALDLAKQHIRNSGDQDDLSSQNGIFHDDYGGNTYYVSSPTGMDSPLHDSAAKKQQVSHVGPELSSYAINWPFQDSAMPISNCASVESHNLLRGTKSAFENNPLFEIYHRPRGKVHLGNGITLYTD